MKITLTRRIEVRREEPDERFPSVWNGTRWVYLHSRPFDPELGWSRGLPEVRSTSLAFVRSNVLPLEVVRPRPSLTKKDLTRYYLGVIRRVQKEAPPLEPISPELEADVQRVLKKLGW